MPTTQRAMILPQRDERIIIQCLEQMMVPIARFCMRHALKLQDLIEIGKRAMLRVAEQQARAINSRLSGGFLSVMTGVHRKDVARIRDEKDAPARSSTLVIRVMGQWHTDPRFCTAAGEPRVLTADSADCEFATLVEAVSKDLRAGAVLRELERVGAVARTPRGVKLVKSTFTPRKDALEGVRYLASDTEDLLNAVQDNIFGEAELPNFHIRTEYDNISEESLAEIRKWILVEGTAFHKRAMKFISKFDRDVNPALADKKCGARVKLVGFSITEQQK